MTTHIPLEHGAHVMNTDDPTYHDFARDLRALADTFDRLADQLPMCRYPKQGIKILMSMEYLGQVTQAAEALGIKVCEEGGHTDAMWDQGLIHVNYNHISAAHWSKFKAEQARFKKMLEAESVDAP